MSDFENIGIAREKIAFKKSGIGPEKWRARTWRSLKSTKYLQFLMIAPLIYLIVFHYIPMYGITIAFKEYSIREGILKSPWIGFEMFERFFRYPHFWRIIRNTLVINLYTILFSFPAPIIFALALNEIKSSFTKRFAQTVSFLPHFIATATLVGLMTVMLSPVSGTVNIFLNRVFGIEPIYFMIDPRWFRFLYVGSGIWQNIGWGSIIYLAALSRVDVDLIDAATVDGCTRLRKIWHINIPTISSTIIILLILRLGRIISVGAEKIILMYSPNTYEVADVISSYVFRSGIQDARFAYATAVGLFGTVINLIMLVIANQLAKRFSETSLW